MALDWGDTLELARRLSTAASHTEYAVANENAMAALGELNSLLGVTQEIAAELVLLAAYRGASQRAIAEALGVPVSAVAGAKAEAARIAGAREATI